VVATCARERNGEADRGEHENDRRIGGELGEEIGCATRAEGRLRTLAAEGASQVGTLALLQQNHADQEEANDDVDDGEKNDHAGLFL